MATSKKKKKPSPKAKRLAKSRAKAKVPQRASNKTKPVSRNDGQLTEENRANAFNAAAGSRDS